MGDSIKVFPVITYNTVINQIKTFIKNNCSNYSNKFDDELPTQLKSNYVNNQWILDGSNVNVWRGGSRSHLGSMYCLQSVNSDQKTSKYVSMFTDTMLNNDLDYFLTQQIKLTDVNKNILQSDFLNFINNMISFCCSRLRFHSCQPPNVLGETQTVESKIYLIYDVAYDTMYETTKATITEDKLKLICSDDINTIMQSLFLEIKKNIRFNCNKIDYGVSYSNSSYYYFSVKYFDGATDEELSDIPDTTITCTPSKFLTNSIPSSVTIKFGGVDGYDFSSYELYDNDTEIASTYKDDPDGDGTYKHVITNKQLNNMKPNFIVYCKLTVAPHDNDIYFDPTQITTYLYNEEFVLVDNVVKTSSPAPTIYSLYYTLNGNEFSNPVPSSVAEPVLVLDETGKPITKHWINPLDSSDERDLYQYTGVIKIKKVDSFYVKCEQLNTDTINGAYTGYRISCLAKPPPEKYVTRYISDINGTLTSLESAFEYTATKDFVNYTINFPITIKDSYDRTLYIKYVKIISHSDDTGTSISDDASMYINYKTEDGEEAVHDWRKDTTPTDNLLVNSDKLYIMCNGITGSYFTGKIQLVYEDPDMT